MADLYLRIAGVVLRVSGDPALRLIPSPGSARFAVDATPADLHIRVTAGDPEPAGARTRLFDSGGTWQVFRDDDGFFFCFTSPTLGSTPYKTARVRGDASEADVRLNRGCFDQDRPIDPLEYPLDELLMIAALSRGRGVEIHGCGVRDADGSGYLFAGQSGAGKTTIARLWLDEPGATILSDDRVIVRRDAGGFWIYGTPWHGEAPLASPERARLSQVFLLRQHAQHEIIALTRGSAAARLFAASFPLFYSAPALDFSLRFLDELVADVPCVELGFAPNSSLPGFARCSAMEHRLRS